MRILVRSARYQNLAGSFLLITMNPLQAIALILPLVVSALTLAMIYVPKSPTPGYSVEGEGFLGIADRRVGLRATLCEMSQSLFRVPRKRDVGSGQISLSTSSRSSSGLRHQYFVELNRECKVRNYCFCSRPERAETTWWIRFSI